MILAVTYENGQVFQHFGHTGQFKLFQVDGGAVTSSRIVDTNGSGHGALAGFLAAHHVDALICGGIGGGARTALAQAGIQLYPGVSGDADQAVASHHEHDHGHDCATHDCAQDHQGCPGNH